MSALEGLASNRSLLFDGSNYAFWFVRMRAYLVSLGFDVWNSVATGYMPPQNPPSTPDEKRAF